MADVAINADTVDIPSVNFAQQGADVAAPGAGRWQLYFKAGGLYARNAAGTVVGPFSTGGDVATDPLWDAAGDLAVGTGANAAAKLAIGTAYQPLRVKGDASTLEYGYQPQCRVRKSTDTTIAHNATAALAFDVEDYDLAGMHEGVTHPSRVTVPVTGNYAITAQVVWKTGSFASGPVLLNLKKNNTTTLALDYKWPAGGGFTTCMVATEVPLVAGDYLEVVAENYEQESHDVSGGEDRTPVLTVRKVG